MENGIVKKLIKTGKILFLSLLWIIFSIPVVTIGASTCAFCYVSLKLLDNTEGNIFAWFIKSFKGNLKQGTLMWLFTVPAFYGVYLCWKTVIAESAGFFAIILVICFTIMAIICTVFTYPVIAHYENNFKSLVKSGIGVSLQNLKSTGIVIIVASLFFFIWRFNSVTKIAGLFILPPVFLHILCSLVNPIFKRLENPVED